MAYTIRPSRLMFCAVCQCPMSRTRTSRPEGVATCRTCQRRAHGLAPDQLVRDFLNLPKQQPVRACARCGVQFGGTGERRRKFCSDECWRKARNSRGSGSPPRRKTTERGYGSEHQRLRSELLPFAYGQDCTICCVTLEPGDDLHLDHTEDREGYRGFAHAWCNSYDGATRKRGASASA